MSSVPKRFRGKAGKARLFQALCSQKVVGGDETIARELLAVATVSTTYPSKNAPDLMTEGEFGSDIYFVLSGSVAIRIKRKQVNVRSPGDHVGEMALIDPLYPRSATVTALERTEVARVAESDFTAIAQRHPIIWRRLCVELGNRLRQRGNSIPSPNNVPVVFIGSSSKKKRVMNAIERAIKSRHVKVRKWTKGVFGLSATTIESLERTISSSDFAIIILSGDDTLKQRGTVKKSPRDNCVFELGLGMGALGRERTFILKEKGGMHLPTDLEGVTYHSYDPAPPERMQRHIKAAASRIKAKINELKTK
jgi:CRP/FNR family transcriptional regulator, cyclic AMP receptor protein